jgi:DNA-binding response OmpR family regulator
MRLLLIEDEKQVRESLKIALKNECFIVDTAEDGERGSFLARTQDYDLILLDNVLPKKQGIDVCAEIRQSGRTTPIIILTTRDEVPDKLALFNLGADDYVTKPFSFEELVARIRAVLRRPRPMTLDALTIDDLTVDLNSKLVQRNNQELTLTKKEYELLVYLIRNQGKILSRGAIMEHVWDMNADPFSNTLETHILNLRRKIDSTHLNKLIHTVPGRGYKLEIKK